MDYLNSILSQPNTKQLVAEAIPTLCNRLEHATLSTDRRSAVLGLKSFSRQYREIVVEYGLKALVSILRKDSGNGMIVKPILETLLVLFLRGQDALKEEVEGGNGGGDESEVIGWISQQSRLQNGKYRSPLFMDEVKIDQFSLWIADELTQDFEVVSILIEVLLENDNIHTKLYAIQILESLVCTRAERTKECLLNIPTAVSTLVALLKDAYDPVRNEAILLLMAVVNKNFNIQKLVAFENTFDTLFDIIDEEGGMRGSILVQDCLTLITNLLQYNASNQKYFIETLCIPRLEKFIREPLDDDGDIEFHTDASSGSGGGQILWTEQRLENMTTALDICRILVSEDNEFLTLNQNKLFAANILFTVLKQVFSPVIPNSIRSMALLTSGDLIRGNADLQLKFSQIDVPYMDPSMPSQVDYSEPIPVTSALLCWALYINSVHTFDIRMSALSCLHSYFKDNNDAKLAFLSDQIKSYSASTTADVSVADDIVMEERGTFSETNGTESTLSQNQQSTKDVISRTTPKSFTSVPPTANLFSTLMDYDSDNKLNPYRVWFAAVVLIYLIEENDKNKHLLMNVHTGDEAAGEEVMSAIQAMSGLLLTTIESNDQRISIGYLMLLTVWLYEDFEAVNDFLSDPTVVKSLIAFLSNNSTELTVLVQGMTVVLLGVVYEFSSKNSPFSRSSLHTLLLKTLGRDNYSLKVRQFKDNVAFKNFDGETVLDTNKDNTGLPGVYFDSIYVNLIKENFPRIRRALFHDPGVDPQGKISYDNYEELDLKHSQLKLLLNDEKEKAEEITRSSQEEIEKLRADSKQTALKLDELTSDLVDSKRTHEELNEKLQSMEKNLAETERLRADFKASSEKYFYELQESRKSCYQLNEKVKALEQQLNLSENAKCKAEEGINKMGRELFQLNKQKKDTEHRLKSLEKELFKSKNEITKVTKNFEDRHLKSLNESNAFKAKLEEVSKRLEESSNSVELSKNELRELQAKNSELEDSNEHLIDKLRSAASAYQEIKQAKSIADTSLEEITKQFNSQKEAVEKLESELESIKKEKEGLSLENISLRESSREEISSLKRNIDELNSSKEHSENMCTELTSELEKLKESLGLEQANYTELKTKLDDEIKLLKNENDRLVQTHDTLVKSHELVKDKHEELNRSLSKSLFEHENTKKELAASTKSKTSELSSLQTELKEKNERISTLEASHFTELTKLNSEIQELEAKLKFAESSSKELKDSLQKQVSEFEELKLKHSEKVSESKKQLEDAEAKLAASNVELDTLKKEKISSSEELSKEKKAAQEKREELESSLRQQSQKIEAVEKEHTNAKDELEKLSRDLKSKESITSEYESKNSSLTSDLESLKNDLSLINSEKEDLLLELNLLKKAKSDMQEMMEKLQKEIDESNVSSDAKAKDFTLLEKKLEDERKELNYEIAVLKSSKERLESDLEEKSKALESQRQMLTENSETVVKEYSDKVKKLEEDKAAVRDEHEKLIQEMNKTKNEVEKQLESLKSDHDELNLKSKEQENTLRSQLKSKHDEIDRIVGEHAKTVSEKIELHEKTKAVFSEQEKKLNIEIEVLKKKLDSNSFELSSKIDDLKNAEEEIKSKEEEKEAIIKELSDAKSALEKSVFDNEILKTDLEKQADLVDTVASLEDELNTLQDYNLELEKSVSEKDSSVAKLEESKNLLLQELQSLKTSSESTSEFLIQLESEIKRLKSELDEKTKQHSILSDEFTLLQGKKSESEEAKAQLSELKEQIKALTESMSKEKSDKELLQKNLKERELDLDTFKANEKSLSEQNSKYKDLLQEHRDLKSAHDAFQAELNELKSSHAKKLEELNSQCSVKAEEANVADTKLKDLEKELASLKSELEFTKKRSEASGRSNSTSDNDSDTKPQPQLNAEMVPKSELDDLMLLMSVMDENNKKYKKQLRELGKEVSSDEEGDSSDEESGSEEE